MFVLVCLCDDLLSLWAMSASFCTSPWPKSCLHCAISQILSGELIRQHGGSYTGKDIFSLNAIECIVIQGETRCVFNKEFEQMKQKNIQIEYWAVLFETFQLQKQFAILRNLSISTLRCLCCPEEKPIILLYCADGRGVGPEPHVRSDGEQQQCCSCTSSTARTLMTNLYFIKTFWSSTAALWAYSWWATHGEVQFLYDYLQINIGFTAITTKRIMVQTHTVVNMAVLVIASNCSVILWGRAVAYITVMAFAETVLQKWLEWDCGLQFLWLPCIIRGHSSS